MADTVNFGWTMPTNGGSADTWGVILLAMFADMDTDIWAIKGTADGGLQVSNNLSDLDNAATARQNLEVEIGVDVQAFHANHAAFAGLTLIANKLAYANGTGTLTTTDFTAQARQLLDDTSFSAMRTTLELGSLATLSTVNNSNWSGTDLAIANGGTGASTAADARTNLELVPGTHVQTQSAALSGIAALTPSNDDILQRKAGAWANRTIAQLKTDLALTAADFSLGNVENKSSSTIRGEITSGNVTTALGYTPTSVTGATGSLSASAFRTAAGFGTAATVNTGTAGSTLGKLDTANTYSQAQAFPNGTTVDSKRLARMASGSGTSTGLITVSTSAPSGTPDDGQIWLQVEP